MNSDRRRECDYDKLLVVIIEATMTPLTPLALLEDLKT